MLFPYYFKKPKPSRSFVLEKRGRGNGTGGGVRKRGKAIVDREGKSMERLKSKSDSTLVEKGNKVTGRAYRPVSDGEGAKEKYNVGRQKRMDEKTGSMLGELHGEK